ncbi:MAG: SDR family NAD(P)-dependent oxidoreductase [Candidatus Binataceae bacterium]|jgi:NAD(P)-dependent dehydrogenase (short-subunit alcohol dehydrogenase family)
MPTKHNPENKPVAVVTGVGPGLGAALARRFAHTYAVAILARRADYLKALAEELRPGGATVLDLACDVGNLAQLTAAFRTIRDDLGEPDVLLYNAGTGSWGTVTEITPEQYEKDWRVNAYGAFVAAKEVVPAMVARGRGAILFTGATAGVKAGAKSISFGPAKFAMRGLAQSLARDLGPKGVHVAWINVDGSIDIPGARGRKPTLNDGDFLKPEAIAETYWHLAHQDPSAWTMELEVRPFKEKF